MGIRKVVHLFRSSLCDSVHRPDQTAGSTTLVLQLPSVEQAVRSSVGVRLVSSLLSQVKLVMDACSVIRHSVPVLSTVRCQAHLHSIHVVWESAASTSCVPGLLLPLTIRALAARVRRPAVDSYQVELFDAATATAVRAATSQSGVRTGSLPCRSCVRLVRRCPSSNSRRSLRSTAWR